jgi:hypothetical protein
MIETTAKIIYQMFINELNPKREALDFIIKTYKKSLDQDYKNHLKDVFWHIVDNYVDNI